MARWTVECVLFLLCFYWRLCVYVCISTCVMCVMYVCVCMGVCIFVCVCIPACVHAGMCAPVCVLMQACMCVCACVCTFVRACRCVYSMCWHGYCMSRCSLMCTYPCSTISGKIWESQRSAQHNINQIFRGIWSNRPWAISKTIDLFYP